MTPRVHQREERAATDIIGQQAAALLLSQTTRAPPSFMHLSRPVTNVVSRGSTPRMCRSSRDLPVPAQPAQHRMEVGREGGEAPGAGVQLGMGTGRRGSKQQHCCTLMPTRLRPPIAYEARHWVLHGPPTRSAARSKQKGQPNQPVKKMLRPDCTSCSARCCSSHSAAKSSPPPAAALLSALLARAARLPAAAPREKPLAAGATPPPGPLRSEMTLPPPQPLLLGTGPPAAAPMVLSERGASGRRFCFRPGLTPALPLQGAPAALLPPPPPLPTPACFSSTRLTRSRSSVRASGSAPLMLSWMHLEAAVRVWVEEQRTCLTAEVSCMAACAFNAHKQAGVCHHLSASQHAAHVHTILLLPTNLCPRGWP